jgi:hypothetical protein
LNVELVGGPLGPLDQRRHSCSGSAAEVGRRSLWRPPPAGGVSFLEGCILGLTGPIDEKPAEQARTGADAGAEPGIAADRANYRAAAGPDGRAGQRALLGWGHIGASSDRQRESREQQ